MKKIIMLSFLVVVFFSSLLSGIEKAEKLECQKWESQAEQLPGFYYTEWQADQCGIN